MSFETVKKYFENAGMGSRVKLLAQSSATVELAAQAVGCEAKRIAKTLSFMLDDRPILIVAAGDARIDNKKYKDCFHKKAKMIHGDEVERMTGHAPGGVCPFVCAPGVDVYLDVSLKRFATVYPAAGSDNSAVELSMDELEKFSNSKDWIDVCKDWE